MTPDSPSSLPTERLLGELRGQMRPSAGMQARIKGKIQARIAAPALLAEVRDAIRPSMQVRLSVWTRVAESVGAGRTANVWETIRQTIAPGQAVHATIWQRVLGRMEPMEEPAFFWKPLKLAAAFALLLIAVRVSPVLFLASPTVAEASVNVIPTGQVGILSGGLWQPLQGEVVLQKGATIQTNEGEATVVLYDDAVIRLGAHTTIAINDFSDRPTAPTVTPTISLQEGELWVMGLVPRDMDGISIGTAEGRVVVHEGSVALHQTTKTSVAVWHRSAVIERRGQKMSMLAGERVDLRRNEAAIITKSDATGYDRPWVSRNLTRDAVHQREIAQIQQERRAASAGILPNTAFYPAKRLAEAVDVLFTFNSDAKARKIISQANTRLNEAAALITRGSGSEALEPLREYRETIVAVATGSGASGTVSSLIAQEVTEATADVSASLPDDASYALKQAVRQTIAALPGDLPRPDTASADILDELSSVKRKAEEGNVEEAKLALEELKSQLSSLEGASSSLTSVQEEVEATLTSVAAVIVANDATAAAPDTSLSLVERRALQLERAKTASSSSDQPPRSPEEVGKEAQEIYNRIIHTYQSDRGRNIQLHLELARLNADPDRGRIMRQLSRMLAAEGLGEQVRDELKELGSENDQ